jgi:hypothetical protein
MASEEEPPHDLKLAISSKILELEGLTRAAGDAVSSLLFVVFTPS